jgi:hypothetical protein
MFRIVGELLHPIAQLRHMHAQVLRNLHIGHASLLDQAHSLKLELLFGQLFAQAMWSPTRLQGRALSPKAGSQGSYLCAGTNFRNGCLFGTSMLINGRLGRQLSLVLSGIAKGRGAGFLLVVTRSAKMMAD